jgi:DNA polymerase-3 subunit gamma/tau
VSDIANHLSQIAVKEGIDAENEGLHLIAQKAEGALRDALSIFDQIVSFAGKTITYKSVIDNLNVLDYDYYFRLVEYALEEDISSSLLLYHEIVDHGFDGHQFIVGLSEHYRNLLIGKDPKTVALLDVADSVKERYKSQSNQLDSKHILRALGVLSNADSTYKSAKNQRLLVELTLMQLCSIKNELEKKKP